MSSFSQETSHPLYLLSISPQTTSASFFAILPSHLLFILSAEEPLFTGEVESRKGKHFILKHKEVLLWSVPLICSLSILIASPIFNMGVQGEADKQPSKSTWVLDPEVCHPQLVSETGYHSVKLGLGLVRECGNRQ